MDWLIRGFMENSGKVFIFTGIVCVVGIGGWACGVVGVVGAGIGIAGGLGAVASGATYGARGYYDAERQRNQNVQDRVVRIINAQDRERARADNGQNGADLLLARQQALQDLRINDLEQQVHEKDEQILALQGQVNEKDHQLAQQRQETTQLRNRVNGAPRYNETEMARLFNQIDTLKAERDNLLRQIPPPRPF